MSKNKSEKKPAKSSKPAAKKPAAKPTRIKAPNITDVELSTAAKMAGRKDGVSAGELAARLVIEAPRASHVLRKLSDRGDVRLEGVTRSARYFADEAGVKPAPLDPSIARYVASFVANLRAEGTRAVAGAYGWGAERGLSGPQVRQLLAHVCAEGLVERHEHGDEVTYRAAGDAAPPSPSFQDAPPPAPASPCGFTDHGRRTAGGEGPAYPVAVAAEVASAALSLPSGTETLLLSLAGLPEVKRRALLAGAERVSSLERQLDAARAALRVEMTSAEVVSVPGVETPPARQRAKPGPQPEGEGPTNKVRTIMADGRPWGVSVLAEHLGMPRTIASATVTRLANAGELERVERGVYRLKAAS